MMMMMQGVALGHAWQPSRIGAALDADSFAGIHLPNLTAKLHSLDELRSSQGSLFQVLRPLPALGLRKLHEGFRGRRLRREHAADLIPTIRHEGELGVVQIGLLRNGEELRGWQIREPRVGLGASLPGHVLVDNAASPKARAAALHVAPGPAVSLLGLRGLLDAHAVLVGLVEVEGGAVDAWQLPDELCAIAALHDTLTVRVLPIQAGARGGNARLLRCVLGQRHGRSKPCAGGCDQALESTRRHGSWQDSLRVTVTEGRRGCAGYAEHR